MAQSRVYLNILSELERKCILLISAVFCWLSQISLLYCSSLLLVYLCWFSVLLSTQRGMLKSPIIIMDVCFFCSFCQFCFIYFESLQLGAYKLRIFMSSGLIYLISLVILILNSTLSDVNITTLAFLWLMFAWYIFLLLAWVLIFKVFLSYSWILLFKNPVWKSLLFNWSI